ncbi:hypothetical protein DIPPA_12105 [Diplonema papillatum]|nr:hypothetical protein DIPPA_12105 [Diplonema papillatum]
MMHIAIVALVASTLTQVKDGPSAVCEDKASCGGFLGTPCKSRSDVCIDDPSDDCNPLKGGADCMGCCVFDQCMVTKCSAGFTCQLNTLGQAECVKDEKEASADVAAVDVCEDKASCGGFLGTPCKSRSDVCIDDPSDDCNPLKGGADCMGCCVFDQCMVTKCSAGFTCQLNTLGQAECVKDEKESSADVAAVDVCEDKASCGGFLGTPCKSRSDVCIDDPSDDCNPLKGGADCMGCCVFDQCMVTKCSAGFTCQLNTLGQADCVKDEKESSADVAAVDVCEDKASCGGFLGTPCKSRSDVCIDDPSDDCNPLEGGADCMGCCVFNQCLAAKCSAGFTCQLNTLGQAECVKDEREEKQASALAVVDVCEDKASCGGFLGTPCKSRSDVCIDDPSDDCNPLKGGADCMGCCVFDQCMVTKCSAGFTCQLNTLGQAECVKDEKEASADVAAVDVCEDKASCGGFLGTPCKSRSDVCIDDPSDDCNPLKGGADCMGCCVFDQCMVTKCSAGFTCQLNTLGQAECVKDEKESSADVAAVDVCEDKASCGGFLGTPCKSRSDVCIDDPSDDCNPLEGGADCMGCCVFNQCLAAKCSAGFKCQLNTLGQAECVKDEREEKQASALAVVDVCEDKASCGGFLGTPCKSRSDVCIDDPSDDCNPLKGGADCMGCCVFDQCMVTKCSAGFTCQLNTLGQAECVKDEKESSADVAAVDVCKDKASCGGFLGTPCKSRSDVCIDDPSDDCNPLKGGADCMGCCVFDQCMVTKCSAGFTCQLNTLGQAECVKDEKEASADVEALEVCKGKASCGGILGEFCESKSDVCIDNPSDDCNPLKGGADCMGCCVFNQCMVTKCSAGFKCVLSTMGQAECVKDRPECCLAVPSCPRGFSQTKACNEKELIAGDCVEVSLCCSTILCRSNVQ